ncbi:MAG: DUF1152 domain-containing protein [Crenarchaeota archaeon]|nr:MAG: DUF1152 domain-containing protein [Thermoproteota archaeon]
MKDMDGLMINIPPLPFEYCNNIMIVGIGGGFDVFTGLPFVFAFPNKNFILVNSSPLKDFLYRETTLDDYPECGIEANVFKYTVGRHGTKLLAKAYKEIAEKHEIDFILAVDGGIDSLMFGDEQDSGTLLEDCISMSALDEVEVDHKILCCAGFGAETEEGINHYRALENIATLTKEDGFIGSFSLTKQMAEFKLYKNICERTWKAGRKSHIQTKIISSVMGQFGDDNLYDGVDAKVIGDSGLVFISPLSSIFWLFNFDVVIKRNLIIPKMKLGATFSDALLLYRQFLNEQTGNRSKLQLPI